MEIVIGNSLNAVCARYTNISECAAVFARMCRTEVEYTAWNTHPLWGKQIMDFLFVTRYLIELLILILIIKDEY